MHQGVRVQKKKTASRGKRERIAYSSMRAASRQGARNTTLHSRKLTK